MSKMKEDLRIDPRIKAVLGDFPALGFADVASRQQALDEANTPDAVAEREAAEAMFEMIDNEAVAPSAGLEISTHEFTSSPDGNNIKVQLLNVNWNLASGLRSINSKWNAVIAADAPNGPDRLNRTNHIGGMVDDNQPGICFDFLFEIIRVDKSVCVEWYVVDLYTVKFVLMIKGTEDGIVFEGCCDGMVALF